uniref:Transmembrane channel-like protein n=1 Tax=Gasterosteus aculeatus aculeatus TaxID=481459 RepID=G3Q5M9_GASAC
MLSCRSVKTRITVLVEQFHGEAVCLSSCQVPHAAGDQTADSNMRSLAFNVINSFKISSLVWLNCRFGYRWGFLRLLRCCPIKRCVPGFSPTFVSVAISLQTTGSLQTQTDASFSAEAVNAVHPLPPSGRSRGAIISQYYNRTMQLRRRRQSRPAIRDFPHSARPSIRGYGIEVDTTDAEVSKRDRLVNNLQNLSVGDRIRMLRAMPLNLTEKRNLRQSTLHQGKNPISASHIPCCSQLKYYIIIVSHALHLKHLSVLLPLKRVSGRFGTGVLSYFLFLKTLLFFNFFLFLVTGAFLVLPQAIHPPVLPAGRRSFVGLELLTGAGYFSDTVMYYGYYCNYTLSSSCRDEDGGQNVSLSNGTRPDCTSKRLSYNMPLAYFSTIGVSFFITCIILVYSMSKSFGRSFRIDNSHSILAMKVLCSWDFKVIKKSSVKLMSENICTQVKELLAEVNHKHVKNTGCQKLWRMMVHGLAWAICIASTTACVLAIYYFSDHMHRQPLLDEASLLALPVVVSLINLLLPGLFNLAAWMEDYDSPSVRTYVAIGRLFSEKVLKRRRKPVFDIARNVLELIYGQTLAWLGVLFTPLLPAVQICKLLLLFYIKMSSVMMNCQAPRKPYRVSQMTTVFITLLCFPSFLGASVFLTSALSLTPSSSCGPFRKLKTMFQAGKRWVEALEKDNPNLSVLARAHSYLVENPFFLFVGAGIFLVVIYFHSQVVDGQRKIIALLQEQIENEGEDKKFLITRLQSIHERRKTPERSTVQMQMYSF